MFDYISGKLVVKEPDRVVIDVQGIGYACQIAASSYETLPDVGKPAKLYIYNYVREDAFELFGFTGEGERAFFEVLLNVSGIGPRLALAALSTMQPVHLRDAIVGGDSGMLTEISGVGRKTADRMIVELRDKVAELNIDGGVGAQSAGSGSDRTAIRADARKALVELGMSRAAAEKNVRKVLRDNDDVNSAEELLRLALRS